MVVGQTGDYVDVLVVGGGPGGYSAAMRAAQLGRSVVLVERQRIGGVCLNDGCIPSKALIHVSRLFRELETASILGIDARPQFDFARFRSWKDSIVGKLSAGVTQLLDRYHVTVRSGTVHFASEHRVAVEQGDQFEFIDFGSAIIATGSRPVAPEGMAFDGHGVVSPEDVLAFEHLPASAAIIGAGYVGIEIATALRRLGSSVSLASNAETILPELDLAISQAVVRGLRSLGVQLSLGVTPRAYGDGRLELVSKDGSPLSVQAETVIAAAERAPNSEALGLDRASVETDAGRSIVVDGACRTSASSIYAVGDVTAGPAVAHRAIAQGRVAAEAACGRPAAFDVVAIPFVCYAEPEVISVGLSDAAAKREGYSTVTARFPFGASGRAATLADAQGILQLVAEAGSERLLGVHAAGPLVAELAGEAAMAIELGATIQDLALVLHPHPSISEAIPEAAWLALGSPLHVFQSR